jgi:hypothetical protein
MYSLTLGAGDEDAAWEDSDVACLTAATDLRAEARLARALAGFFAFAICNLLGALKAATNK